LEGIADRHFAQIFFPCPIHFWKHFKQKLWPQGVVTGRSGSCIQKVQFKLSSNISNTLFRLASRFEPLTSPLLSCCLEDPLAMSSCLFLAFSSSLSFGSAWIALIWLIKSSPGAPDDLLTTTGSDWLSVVEREQSGQNQSPAGGAVKGGFRHCICQGLTQPLQSKTSLSGGTVLQTMQTPSPSQGKSAMKDP
jgi:hypothetical protein